MGLSHSSKINVDGFFFLKEEERVQESVFHMALLEVPKRVDYSFV